MTTPTPNPDWQRIAVRVFQDDGRCGLLTTPERDALLAAVEAAPPADPLMPLTDALAQGADLGAVIEAGRTLAAVELVHPFQD